METWLQPALDYLPQWLELQMRMSEQPGCVVAIAPRTASFSRGPSARPICRLACR
jgi:hypothetical protein